MISANADDGEDLIVFERSLFSTAQTITLTGGELDITHNLSIIAPRDTLTGGDLVTISGNNTSRVFEIELGATVNLNGLIIADGRVVGNNGGGIRNSGTLILDNSIIRDSSAVSFIRGGIINDANGGGIFNGGQVNTPNITIINSTISGNSAPKGGGIFNSYIGTVTLLFSTVTQNQAANGGGVYFDSIPLFSTSRTGSNSIQNTIIASNLNRDNGVNPDVSGTFTSNGYNLIGDSTGSTGFGVTADIVGTSDHPLDF